MEMLLFLVIVAGMIALAFFHSQISELRSALANLQDKLSHQARSFERRLAELEAASAARRTETAAAAAPQSTAAPISDPARSRQRLQRRPLRLPIPHSHRVHRFTSINQLPSPQSLMTQPSKPSALLPTSQTTAPQPRPHNKSNRSPLCMPSRSKKDWARTG